MLRGELIVGDKLVHFIVVAAVHFKGRHVDLQEQKSGVNKGGMKIVRMEPCCVLNS